MIEWEKRIATFVPLPEKAQKKWEKRCKIEEKASLLEDKARAVKVKVPLVTLPPGHRLVVHHGYKEACPVCSLGRFEQSTSCGQCGVDFDVEAPRLAFPASKK